MSASEFERFKKEATEKTREEFGAFIREIGETGEIRKAPEEIYVEFIRNKGFDVTVEDIGGLRGGKDNLSEEDLSMVIGGGFSEQWVRRMTAGFATMLVVTQLGTTIPVYASEESSSETGSYVQERVLQEEDTLYAEEVQPEEAPAEEGVLAEMTAEPETAGDAAEAVTAEEQAETAADAAEADTAEEQAETAADAAEEQAETAAEAETAADAETAGDAAAAETAEETADGADEAEAPADGTETQIEGSQQETGIQEQEVPSEEAGQDAEMDIAAVDQAIEEAVLEEAPLEEAGIQEEKQEEPRDPADTETDFSEMKEAEPAEGSEAGVEKQTETASEARQDAETEKMIRETINAAFVSLEAVPGKEEMNRAGSLEDFEEGMEEAADEAAKTAKEIGIKVTDDGIDELLKMVPGGKYFADPIKKFYKSILGLKDEKEKTLNAEDLKKALDEQTAEIKKSIAESQEKTDKSVNEYGLIHQYGEKLVSFFTQLENLETAVNGHRNDSSLTEVQKDLEIISLFGNEGDQLKPGGFFDTLTNIGNILTGRYAEFQDAYAMQDKGSGGLKVNEGYFHLVYEQNKKTSMFTGEALNKTDYFFENSMMAYMRGISLYTQAMEAQLRLNNYGDDSPEIAGLNERYRTKYNNSIMTSNSAGQKVEKMAKIMFGDANAADEKDQVGILEYVSNFYDNIDRCIFINKGQKEVVLKNEMKVRTTGAQSGKMVENENFGKDQPLSPSEIESVVKHAGAAGFTMEDYLKWVGFNTDNIKGVNARLVHENLGVRTTEMDGYPDWRSNYVDIYLIYQLSYWNMNKKIDSSAKAQKMDFIRIDQTRTRDAQVVSSSVHYTWGVGDYLCTFQTR